MAATHGVIPENTIPVLDHGFVRLDDAMASDLSVVNGARVSFARRKEEMDSSDEGLIRFLMRDRHGCYDDATEVLTDSGWRPWPKVTGEELFATRSPVGTLEYQPALRLVRKELRGHMIGFKGMSIDLLVTPDHRVLTAGLTTKEGRKSPVFSLGPAHGVLWKAHRHVATANWTGPTVDWLRFDGVNVPAKPLLSLVGFFIGDGNLHPRANHIVFNLPKDREIAFLRRVAHEAGFEVKRWQNGHAVQIGRELRRLFSDCYRDHEKIIPRRLLHLGRDLLEALYGGLLESAGSRLARAGGAERQTYSTTSRELASSVQELALKIGRSATVRPHKVKPGDGHFGRKPRWRVTIYAARNSRPSLCLTRSDAGNHMGVEQYDGLIHCVEVPNGTLYVRRNGYPVFSGNTPFEHNAFRFHIRAPIFVAREWMRHRIGCLTGDTEVTFVNRDGVTSPQHRKTVDELWRMWTVGERNGHALRARQRAEIDRLAAEGISMRAISRKVGVGRRAVASHLRGANEYRDSRWRVRRMRLRVLNEETGEFGVGHICDILDKGLQPVYRLTFADGVHLTVTENHRLLTNEGWKTMGDALGLSGAGDSAQMTQECHLMANGVTAYRNYEWMKARRREGKSVAEIAQEAGCSYDTVRKWLVLHDLRFSREERYRSRLPWNKGLCGYRTRMVVSEAHREAIRRARSGARSNFWRGGVNSRRASVARWTKEQAPKVHAQYDYTCQVCGGRGGQLHAHHIVPVWLDDSLATEIGNLITVCGRCHPQLHRTREAELEFVKHFAPSRGFARDVELPHRRGYKLTAHPVKVVSVDYVGMRQTYDLSVEGPWHNFVANGIVVHNSFNEFSMRYAKATDEFYVPEPEDVRTQVGKPGAYSFEPVSADVAEQTREELRAVYEAAYATYERLVELGVARELARSVMPVGAYTEFYWTVNARALMNFVSLRAHESAQREIRRYAEAVERFLAEKMPVTHAAFVANDRTAP